LTFRADDAILYLEFFLNSEVMRIEFCGNI